MSPRPITHTRLSMYRTPSGRDELLLVARDARCYAARAVAAHLKLTLPATLESALQDAIPAADEALARAWAVVDAPAYDGPGRLERCVRAPLFRRPGKILCVGLNFRRHAEEMRSPLPAWPVLFSKFNNALSCTGAVVNLPAADTSYKIDYETELVIVVGQRISQAPAASAQASVAGYCTGHDVSARDLQKERGGQWLLGKTLDGFAPIGPDFVGSALAGDPDALSIETRVNGTTVQSSSTADFIFPVAEVLAYVSRHFPLDAGDLIFTGTPEGVIAGKPAAEQRWLRAGDQIESTVGGLGTLRFRFG
jgi:2-keto-4-pentenoate hydratase/2-oxohepta-3-ene-1,7-dioic acid hydratase in catechol pathway